MAAMIELRDLTKRYGDLTAVEGLNLTIEEGGVFGFIGPNGAGKTTTMRIMTTLLRPTSGEVRIAGHSVTDEPLAVRRLIGYMPDFFGVYEDMKVWEYLDFFAACYNIPPATRGGMIDDLLALVDLGHKRDAYVETLSRGMKQRLCLARTLTHDPQVLHPRRTGRRSRSARPDRDARTAARASAHGQDHLFLVPYPVRGGRHLHQHRHHRKRPPPGRRERGRDDEPLARPPACHGALRARRGRQCGRSRGVAGRASRACCR